MLFNTLSADTTATKYNEFSGRGFYLLVQIYNS